VATERDDQRSAWWVVGGVGQVLTGPFPDRVGALDAVPADEQSWENEDSIEVVFGARRDDDTITRRPSPADKAFEAHLAEQLQRASDGWDPPLPGHPHAELAGEVATALVEAGFDLHHCAAYSALGGVCLTPTLEGVIVTWTQHDRMAKEQLRGYTVQGAVQDTMNRAVWDVLAVMGFGLTQFGRGGRIVAVGVSSPAAGR
jgi:hypothetical protein